MDKIREELVEGYIFQQKDKGMLYIALHPYDRDDLFELEFNNRDGGTEKHLCEIKDGTIACRVVSSGSPA